MQPEHSLSLKLEVVLKWRDISIENTAMVSMTASLKIYCHDVMYVVALKWSVKVVVVPRV